MDTKRNLIKNVKAMGQNIYLFINLKIHLFKPKLFPDCLLYTITEPISSCFAVDIKENLSILA